MQKHTKEDVYGILRQLNIAYERTTHDPVYTMEACTDISEKLGAAFCKNLFLRNRAGTKHYLMLLTEDKKFRAAHVRDTLGVEKLCFAEADELYEYLGLTQGAVSPIGLLNDRSGAVELIMDSDIRKLDKFCVHVCDNTESVSISVNDFFDKFLSYTGHTPIFYFG